MKDLADFNPTVPDHLERTAREELVSRLWSAVFKNVPFVKGEVYNTQIAHLSRLLFDEPNDKAIKRKLKRELVSFRVRGLIRDRIAGQTQEAIAEESFATAVMTQIARQLSTELTRIDTEKLLALVVKAYHEVAKKYAAQSAPKLLQEETSVRVKKSAWPFAAGVVLASSLAGVAASHVLFPDRNGEGGMSAAVASQSKKRSAAPSDSEKQKAPELQAPQKDTRPPRSQAPNMPLSGTQTPGLQPDGSFIIELGQR